MGMSCSKKPALFHPLTDENTKWLAGLQSASGGTKHRPEEAAYYDQPMRHKTKNTVSSSGRPTECSPNPPTTHSAKLPTTTSGDDRPTLLQLICFPFQGKTINIVQMIGADYFDLGVSLLQDETGAIMNSLVR